VDDSDNEIITVSGTVTDFDININNDDNDDNEIEFDTECDLQGAVGGVPAEHHGEEGEIISKKGAQPSRQSSGTEERISKMRQMLADQEETLREDLLLEELRKLTERFEQNKAENLIFYFDGEAHVHLTTNVVFMTH